MIKIALCDDNAMQQEILKDQVSDYINNKNLDTEVTVFSSGLDLLDYIEKNGGFDIYILDMIMPGMKGIDLGASLRQMGDNGVIIYLTVTNAFVSRALEVKASIYLLKPIRSEQLASVLDNAINHLLEGTEL